MLLQSIFYPHSPLHDGAVLIRENRIVAARAILPLPRGKVNLATRVGTDQPLTPELLRRVEAAEAVLDNPDLNADQAAIDKATANLNAALNTMRPGNLPELEDMDELLPLLEKARAIQQPSPQVKEAVEYAEMVVKYVSDGSGTMDMIQKATDRLKPLVNSKPE